MSLGALKLPMDFRNENFGIARVEEKEGIRNVGFHLTLSR
jgi:hypothetical protein